jgi:ATP phosphoribosyltransferase
LKVNHLKEIAIIAKSNAVMITNEKVFKKKKDEIEELVAAVESVENAANKRYLMADVPVKSLEAVRKHFPGIAGPTIMNIMGRDDVVAIHVVIEKDSAYDAIAKLKRLGASGILIVPIDRMVP